MIQTKEDKRMDKKVRNIVLVTVGILAVAGIILAVVAKKRKAK